jgi:hypothetical protein
MFVITPALRRFIANGYRHVPLRDAPNFGMVCLESVNQRVFVDPETGDCRVGSNAPGSRGR